MNDFSSATISPFPFTMVSARVGENGKNIDVNATNHGEIVVLLASTDVRSGTVFGNPRKLFLFRDILFKAAERIGNLALNPASEELTLQSKLIPKRKEETA